MSACRSCGAEVVWARTAGGSLAPFEGAEDGTYEIWTDTHNVTHARHAAPDLLGSPRWRSHFATCPQADRWRR